MCVYILFVFIHIYIYVYCAGIDIYISMYHVTYIYPLKAAPGHQPELCAELVAALAAALGPETLGPAR